MSNSSVLLSALVSALLLNQPTCSFVVSSEKGFLRQTTTNNRHVASKTTLWDGRGVATNYSWTEDEQEIEVSVKVPRDTRVKDLSFKAKPFSVDLRLRDGPTLLDGDRKMRGKVSMDGTFWDIRDADRTSGEDGEDDHRIVTVFIEKNLRRPKDDFEIFEPFWRGVYPHDKEEVLERKYDEMEDLNIREYAASLGVDIDNINMSWVDKKMFSSGLNMTNKDMDNLVKKRFVKEVTQQADGTEYTTDEEGDPVPFSRLGEDVGSDELRDLDSKAKKVKKKIPFVDTKSPWDKAVKVDDAEKMDAIRNAAKETEPAKSEIPPDVAAPGGDPIDKLTVVKLKDILREQGLKVSGNKQALKDRLREHVQSLANKSKKG